MNVISVTIYSKLFNPNKTLLEINDSNHKYMIKRADLDAKYNRWQIEAHQLPVTSFLLLEGGDDVLLETGDKIII